MTTNISQCTASSWNALGTLQFVDGWYRTSVWFTFKYGNRKSVVHICGYLHWRYEYEDDSWIKRDQLDVTCFIISLFNAQHVSDVNTSVLRSLLLICWVISQTTHIEPEQYNPWNNSTNKSQAPEDGYINIRNMLSIKLWNNKASDIKLASLYSTINMMHGPINIMKMILDVLILDTYICVCIIRWKPLWIHTFYSTVY